MEKKLPLSGLKVVELAIVVAAPTAGRMLATYGAEVIKIEMPPVGDQARRAGDMLNLPTEDGNNPLFDVCNSGKKVISLNLKTPEGMKVFKTLLADADVFLSNIRMGSLIRMGLDYETLHKEFPRLVYAHLSGHGIEGPDKDLPGYDFTTFWAASGPMTNWLLPDSFPFTPSYGFGDVATSGMFLSGILMALLGREKTGEGTMVTTSLLGMGMWCNFTAVINAQEPYNMPYPQDRYQTFSPVNSFFRTADGEWILVFFKEYPFAKQTLSELFGMPELLTDPRYVDIPDMKANGAIRTLVDRMSEVFAGKTTGEWRKILREYDVPFSVLPRQGEVWKNPQAQVNGYLLPYAYPDGNTPTIPQPPLVFSEYGRRPFAPVGLIGADTYEVMKELGYTPEEIETLRTAGSIL